MNADVQVITSRDNPLLQRLRKQQARPGGYRQSGWVWLEGDHLCRALLERGGRPDQAVISQAAWDGRLDLRELAQAARRVAVVPDALMAGLSTLETPAPLGMLAPWPQEPTAALACQAPVVVLDRLQDPGNVGSILRSAAALGAAQVVALQGTVALWSPKVLRAGMGAHFGLQLFEGLAVTDLEPLRGHLVVTSSHDATVLPKAELPTPCAWVLGHEGGGVDAALEAMATARVGIPQPGGQESLNVAVAAAICLYEGVRRTVG